LLPSVALRLLSVLEWTVRKKLEENGETLKGLYAGQPGRQAKRPSAELLLRAFKGISLTVVEVAGELTGHVTPLTALQRRLLELWGLPAQLYQRLARRETQPARPDQDALRVPSDSDSLTLHFSQPPPIYAERGVRGQPRLPC